MGTTGLTYSVTYCSSDDGLSGADIAGIVVGSVVGALLLVGVIWYFAARQMLRRQMLHQHPSLLRRNPQTFFQGLQGVKMSVVHAADCSFSSNVPGRYWFVQVVYLHATHRPTFISGVQTSL